jgi:predicted ribonuclease YlaK
MLTKVDKRKKLESFWNAEISGLTVDQQHALSALKTSGNLFRLQGYAGTGKSFLICEYIKS